MFYSKRISVTKWQTIKFCESYNRFLTVTINYYPLYSCITHCLLNYWKKTAWHQTIRIKALFTFEAPLTFLLPVARVLHSLFGRDVHVRWKRLVHKSPKAHAQVAGGTVHGLSKALSQRPQAEEVVIHGVGEVHEVVEIHRVILYLTHLHCEALGIIWEME